jgi:hypothetical protein
MFYRLCIGILPKVGQVIKMLHSKVNFPVFAHGHEWKYETRLMASGILIFVISDNHAVPRLQRRSPTDQWHLFYKFISHIDLAFDL